MLSKKSKEIKYNKYQDLIVQNNNLKITYHIYLYLDICQPIKIKILFSSINNSTLHIKN